MKPILKFSAFVLLMPCVVVLASCKKERPVSSVVTPTPNNRMPVAYAGVDQTIILPTNTVSLNGNGSTDPDNNIISYAWSKISGPSSFNIANANAIQIQVTDLVQGVFQFELKVTDAGGLFSKDTLQLIVNAAVNIDCNISNRILSFIK